MKRVITAFVLATALGCGGSSSNTGGGTKNLANFEGTAWNGQLTTVVTCPGSQPQSQVSSFAVQFSPGNGADLEYNSGAGCIFRFNVSGNTASLSNAPVSCASSVGGVPVTATFTSYTATTADGHSLSVATAGSGTAQGVTCPFTQSSTLTR